MRILYRIMVKRARTSSHSSIIGSPSGLGGVNNHPTALKKARVDVEFLPNKIATAENAAQADRAPPLSKLEELRKTVITPAKGDAVVYWMRMEDLRGNYLLSKFGCSL